MKKFNERFHTDDYDQEMLDFIKENYNIWEDDSYPFNLNTRKKLLRYNEYNEFVVTCYEIGEYLTKQQFKEKIGMVNKGTFTKDDLVVGKHIVECRNGSRYVVLEDNVLLELGDLGWEGLDDFEEDLLFDRDNSDEWDIVKVYRVQYKNIHLSKDLPLVWERKSPQQLEIDKLQAEVDERVKRINELKESM